VIVVLMGVSGSGKTTIGELLAQRTDSQFADADDFHSAKNKAKMAAGTPLTDEDRQPWLTTLHDLMRGWVSEGVQGILACSALRSQYRQTLAAGLAPGMVQWVLLDGSKELIAQRLASRHHEYMNPGLLDSQMRTLEPPDDGIRVLNDRPSAEVVEEIVARIALEALQGDKGRQHGTSAF
jgi:gluconokinase